MRLIKFLRMNSERITEGEAVSTGDTHQLPSCATATDFGG